MTMLSTEYHEGCAWVLSENGDAWIFTDSISFIESFHLSGCFVSLPPLFTLALRSFSATLKLSNHKPTITKPSSTLLSPFSLSSHFYLCYSLNTKWCTATISATAGLEVGSNGCSSHQSLTTWYFWILSWLYLCCMVVYAKAYQFIDS
nr:uncharacterized protein LOC103401510 [Malus domestica]